MNKYLVKLSSIIKATQGIPAGQKIPNQTLQVLSQVGDTASKRAARGTMNLGAKGGHNKPRETSVIPQIKKPILGPHT